MFWDVLDIFRKFQRHRKQPNFYVLSILYCLLLFTRKIIQYFKREFISFMLLRDSVGLEYWVEGIYFTNLSLQKERIKTQMKYDSISCWVTVFLSWAYDLGAVLADHEFFGNVSENRLTWSGLCSKAHNRILCQWGSTCKAHEQVEVRSQGYLFLCS